MPSASAKTTCVIPLEWQIDAKGDITALAPRGTYRITFESTHPPGTSGFRVRFAGFPIALAQTLQGAKDYALIHLNR
jgi:hypothetical protein